MNAAKTINSFWTDNHGTVTPEWAIIGVLVVVVAAAAYTTLGSVISEKTNNVAQTITGAW